MPEVFNWNIRVYYEDTDAGGIVFYANYLKFFERARTEWLRHADIGQTALAQDSGVMFVVKSATLDYASPAKMDDQLRVTAMVEKLGRASIQFFQQCWRGDELLCSSRVKVGCVSSDAVKPCAIPAAVFKKIHTTAGHAASLA
jgi:acyl-CoA thioester hydrolase